MPAISAACELLNFDVRQFKGCHFEFNKHGRQDETCTYISTRVVGVASVLRRCRRFRLLRAIKYVPGYVVEYLINQGLKLSPAGSRLA